MPVLLDEFPYPYHNPLARELHLALCQIYPSGKAALFAAERAGLQPFMIDAGQPPYLIWKDILDQAAVARKLRVVVSTANQDFPNSPRQEFLNSLLADQTPPMEGEPRSAEGVPEFRHGSDDILEPEALLFHDDLTLSVGDLPALIRTLEALRRLSPSVCKLEVAFPGARGLGTAFRIGPDLLLTNQHVFFYKGAKTSKVTALFGYEEDAAGQALAARPVACDVASIQTDDSDDWGVIRVSEALDDTIPVLSLSQAAAPVEASSAFIIQHPGGVRKRVAYARNRITLVNDQVVQYLSDTQTGSSGAPVFNGEGKLVALHHAGGRPQEIAGRPPLRKNEGIRIERVLEGIRQAGIAL